MTAQVLQVIEVKDHPNADSLKVYQMACFDKKVQIIANLENVYGVFDHVKVVLAPSILKDGTKIKETKIRGVLSFGMALGKTDLAVGTDLTAEICQEEESEVEIKNGPLDQSIEFVKWPDTEQLHNVRRNLGMINGEKSVKYAGKCKEHGTNSGVTVTKDGTFRCQKRSSLISLESDNAGFCRFIEERKEYFSNLKLDNVTIFGEFVGSGILKGTSINSVPEKHFCIFALYYKNTDDEYKVKGMMDINPETIAKTLGQLPSNVHILPFYGEEIVLDFTNIPKLNESITKINEIISLFEKEDPWVKENFNVDGNGEGLVYYPISECIIDEEGKMLISKSKYENYAFKAKIEKMSVVNKQEKKLVQIDAEFVKNVKEFVKMFVTENRLNQISNDIGFDHKKIGDFIGAFMKDVFKESKAELEKAGLTNKHVSKEVGTAARLWYLNKLNEGLNV